jgi:FkbM family methyltransferase
VSRLRIAHLSRQVISGRSIDELERQALPALVKPGMTVMDIGANIGGYTLDLSRLVGPTGRVFAFEPIPDNASVIALVVKRAARANVSLHPLAIGEADGPATMTIPEQGFAGYYLAHVGEGEGLDVPVSMRSLDSFCAEFDLSPSFIKCDAEGYETNVVRGALLTINRCRPAWLIEVRPNAVPKFFALMRSFRYRIFAYGAGRLEAITGQGKSENYFFLPEEHVASWTGKQLFGGEQNVDRGARV